MSYSDVMRTYMKNSRQLAKTAHDVRHLCICRGCKQLADDRDVVKEMHPSCFYEKFGSEAVLALLADDLGKFRICDLPVHVLKMANDGK